MAMTLRLSGSTEARLEAIAEITGMSKTAVVELAITSYDERAERRAKVQAIVAETEGRDAELLELLEDAADIFVARVALAEDDGTRHSLADVLAEPGK